MKRLQTSAAPRPGPLGLVALAGLALLAGCRVGPDFAVPQTSVPPGWSSSAPTAAAADSTSLARWWTTFHDPTLAGLIEEALRSNLDLRLASARLRQARATHRVATADCGPTLDAAGSARRSQTAAGADNPGSPTVNAYQAGFDASWEIDFFGGGRRSQEAALADVLSSEEARRAVQVSLVAEVAQTYIDLRTQQQRTLIARRHLGAQRRALEVVRQRRAADFVSGLDVASAEAQVATLEAQVPLLEASACQTLQALSVLLGREPGALSPSLSEPAPLPTEPPAVPIGLPADLLRRRPDIRAAEASIHAATARIGVAVADLYPKVTLGVSTGVQAVSAGDLLDPQSRFWSFGPSVTWRVFDSGRTLSVIAVQKALEEQSLLTYRQAVLAALQEVENALVASAKAQAHRASLDAAVTANRRAVALATQLYEAGQREYLDVLDAQGALHSAEDALVQSTGAASTHLITLYKAVGGGWEVPL